MNGDVIRSMHPKSRLLTTEVLLGTLRDSIPRGIWYGEPALVTD